MVVITDPTLSVGLDQIRDYSSLRFINAIKQIREWRNSSFGGIPNLATLQDENGWLTQMPVSGGAKLYMSPQANLSGDYVMTWEGEGTFTATGTTSTGDHRKELTLTPGNFNIDFSAITLGNHIRNIKMFRAEHEALVEAGELFNPEWLALYQGVREIRFMDWMLTNGSVQEEWADRPQLDDITWSGQGTPVEIMVALANKTGTDPWFNIPHMATDEYIEEFATYVKDNLRAGLVATFEYSNEIWNFAPGFGQSGWLDNQVRRITSSSNVTTTIADPSVITWNNHGHANGKRVQFPNNSDTLPTGFSFATDYYIVNRTTNTFELSLTPGGASIGTSGTQSGTHRLQAFNENWTGDYDWSTGGAWLSLGAKYSCNMAQIIRGVFTGQEERIRPVLGVQTGTVNQFSNQHQMITASIWQANEPGEWVSPATLHDAVCGTTYMGSNYFSGNSDTQELLLDYHDTHTEEETFDWLKASIIAGGLANRINDWASMRQYLCDPVSLPLIAYEGGGHLRVVSNNGFSQYVAPLVEIMEAFVASQQMADIYAASWDAWAAVSEGPYMHFTEMGEWGQAGCWGLIQSFEDTNPRTELLHERNAEQDSWFGDGGGDRYLYETAAAFGDNGGIAEVTTRGGIVAGGAGYDLVMMPGASTDYEVSKDEDGNTILVGAGGTTTLVGVDCYSFPGA